ncbi:glycosyl transferase [Microbacterium testaceum]|uniref:glycosyl transferase n=1 Tax=Microbacterium testaceum TaxID=2033 RepID=UPI0025B13228|nr:glycosyl transferase [Microbacterium testaceum]MDZ5144254.1 glycosyl transferase [Microbacterium testaceum]WJS89491.1 glycosyl transferase [Microbacterium testaceum]
MRFVWAVVAFVIAAAMIGAGIAQRTVFHGPSETSANVQTEGSTAFTLIDGAVLNSVPGAQTLRVQGDGAVFASYGRTADVKAWLADVAYTSVTLDDAGTVQTSEVEPTVTPASGTATAGRSPVDSDLWLDEFEQTGSLSTTLQLPRDMSVLVASDGTAPAPANISLTWPIDDSTPWAGPLIVGGGIVLLIGLVLYLLGIRHVRRQRRPRRKGLPLPVTEPISTVGADAESKGVVSQSPVRRGGSRVRGALGGRRALVAVPALGLSVALLAGCSADAWPQLAATESPSPTPTVIVPEGQFPPAVTEAQAQRIVSKVSSTVAQADASLDANVVAERLAGPALAERQTNYKLRAAIADRPALPAIPAEPVQIVLPQTTGTWPRTLMTVVESADAATPTTTIMMMTQQTPWEEYKASYVGNLEASTNLPELAAPYVGATQVPPDSSFLVMAPEKVAAAYADVINNGQNSASFAKFDTANDLLLAAIQDNKTKRTDELNQTGAGTAEISFSASAGTATPIALATLDTGAIVAVNVYESDTAKPTNKDAVIKLDNNPAVKALTGVDQSATGFTTTYSDQVFFYVPSQGSDDQIRLLGYRSSLLEAKVSP